MKTLKLGAFVVFLVLCGFIFFTACGNDDSDGNVVLDFDKWTAVADSKFGTSSIYSIAYGNNTFVAVG